jgi:hypothetical protein
MSRLARVLATASVACVLCLIAAVSAFSRTNPVHAGVASPEAESCGQSVTSWSPATANDVKVELIELKVIPPGPPGSPTPGAPSTAFAHLRLTNLGTNDITVIVGDFELLLCDGSRVRSFDVTGDTDLPSRVLHPGESSEGVVLFKLGDQEQPTRLIVPASRPGLTGGRVEFPLVMSSNATPGAGASGADAVGGDAVGGNGANGADATPT